MSEYRETYDRLFNRANETFKGTKLNEEKYNAYQIILEGAKQLSVKRSRFENISYSTIGIEEKNRNAIVCLERKPPLSIPDGQMQTIAEMFRVADDSTITVLPNGKIRITFGVRDVWSE